VETKGVTHPIRHMTWLVIASVLLAACNKSGNGASSSAVPPASASPPTGSSAPANRAPVITMPPAGEVLVGRQFSLRPSASDPDGQSLSFSISNRPSWLSFSSQTGEVSGTPGAADVGTYTNIRITVSDGQANASVTFGITVLAAATGRATVSWSAPTQRTDGTPLTDLAGFRVYYGNASNSLTQIVEVRDPGARSWVIEDLTRGTWYFAATAFDQTGAESSRSNTASKTIS
jgi:hypothetical protein